MWEGNGSGGEGEVFHVHHIAKLYGYTLDVYCNYCIEKLPEHYGHSHANSEWNPYALPFHLAIKIIRNHSQST